MPATSLGFTSLKSTVRAMPGASTRSVTKALKPSLRTSTCCRLAGSDNDAGALPYELPFTKTSASEGSPWMRTSTSSAARRASSVDSFAASANISRVHGA
jgi:hypothetical protein